MDIVYTKILRKEDASMKRIACLFLCLIIIGLCGCDNKHTTTLNFETATVEIGETWTDFDGVNIKIKNIVWDEAQVKLEVDWINRTEFEVNYGNPYAIELKNGSKWIDRRKIDKLAFDLPAFLLRSGETREKVYDLTDTFDITESGTYRILTDCSVYDKGKNAEPTKCNLWAEFTVKAKDGSDKNLSPVDFKAQYIRTGSKVKVENYPIFSVLHSVEELNAYYEANKDKFDLERRTDIASDSTIGFLDACDKYNKEFFQENALALIVLEVGSGSTRHEVKSLKTDSDKNLYMDISTILPEIGTCDMAQWHIITEIPEKYNGIEVKLDDKLIVNED